LVHRSPDGGGPPSPLVEPAAASRWSGSGIGARSPQAASKPRSATTISEEAVTFGMVPRRKARGAPARRPSRAMEPHAEGRVVSRSSTAGTPLPGFSARSGTASVSLLRRRRSGRGLGTGHARFRTPRLQRCAPTEPSEAGESAVAAAPAAVGRAGLLALRVGRPARLSWLLRASSRGGVASAPWLVGLVAG